MSTDRAGLSEHTASTRPAARWQNERASEPMIRSRCARSATFGASRATSDVRVASKERISTSSFGRTAPSGSLLSHAPSPRRAVHSSREPKSCTKPNTTSSIVSPSATAIESEKKGMPRFALSDPSIGSMTRSGSASAPSRPTSSETIAPAASRTRARIAPSAAWSVAVVSSPPRPAPPTGSRSARVGSRSSTASTSATAARQSSSQASVKRKHQQAGGELRIEERALLRHHVAAARDLPDVLDTRRAQEEGCLGIAAIDGRDRLFTARRVGEAARRGVFDDLRIGAVAGEQLVAARAIEHGAGKTVAGWIDRRSGSGPGVLRDPVRGKDRQSFLPRRDDDREQPRRRLAAVLLVERERRLVAVMAVGDQQLRPGELLDERVAELWVEPPDAVSAALQVRLTETVELDRAVPEEEERLELGAGGAEQPQPPLLRACVRALVRQDDAVLVRLEPECRGEALAAPSDAVRAAVLLYEPPARRLGIAYEDSEPLPLRKARGRLVLGVGQRQVDDVVPASPPELLPLFRSDDVVRRRDQWSERSRD